MFATLEYQKQLLNTLKVELMPETIQTAPGKYIEIYKSLETFKTLDNIALTHLDIKLFGIWRSLDLTKRYL